MNYPSFNSNEKNRKVVFNWDGSAGSIRTAAELITGLNPSVVYAIHVQPHESVYSYGAYSDGDKRMKSNLVQLELTNKFQRAAGDFSFFRSAELKLLFGDRITEIAGFVQRTGAGILLTSPFSQSKFSRWLHGDLNSKLASKLPGCEVISLDSQGRLKAESGSLTETGPNQ
ncbi:MAG: hypothetical protein AAF456_01335 [Planctomycetota bacterium]